MQTFLFLNERGVDQSGAMFTSHREVFTGIQQVFNLLWWNEDCEVVRRRCAVVLHVVIYVLMDLTSSVPVECQHLAHC